MVLGSFNFLSFIREESDEDVDGHSNSNHNEESIGDGGGFQTCASLHKQAEDQTCPPSPETTGTSFESNDHDHIIPILPISPQGFPDPQTVADTIEEDRDYCHFGLIEHPRRPTLEENPTKPRNRISKTHQNTEPDSNSLNLFSKIRFLDQLMMRVRYQEVQEDVNNTKDARTTTLRLNRQLSSKSSMTTIRPKTSSHVKQRTTPGPGLFTSTLFSGTRSKAPSGSFASAIGRD